MAEATAGKRVALITAPTSEVGAAVVARFAREGWATAGCGDAGVRERGPAGDTASGSQPDLTLDGDITRPADAQRIVDAVLDRFGRLDALVNYGAARRVVGTIMDITDAEFDEEMAADLKTVIAVSRYAVPAMARGGGGTIVNLSSIATLGVKGRALRSASKAALSALTRSMALDHAADNIRVNALLVGPTLTSDIRERPGVLETLLKDAPLGRLHTPEDVAAAVYFFASDDAQNITGALLPLDAGRSLPTF
jgi:meso-butanediol dehydrogenase / (S,S)-butanediol dehydrogenase / diacetyl reductase